MKSWHRSGAAGLGLAFLAWCGVAAAGASSPIVGGPGGTPFADQLPAGARIVAVAIKAGGWIDAIAVVYSTPDSQRASGALHGGTGGAACVIPLEEGEPILALQGTHGQFVESVRFITTRGVSRLCGQGGGKEFRIDVPPGQHMAGFSGRAGQYLDAVGLVLEPDAPPARTGGAGAAGGAGAGPVRLLAPPVVNTNASEALVSFDLSSAGTAQVTVSYDMPRQGECFGPRARVVASTPVAGPSRHHEFRFGGLQGATPYGFAIRLADGRCETGRFGTAGKL